MRERAWRESLFNGQVRILRRLKKASKRNANNNHFRKETFWKTVGGHKEEIWTFWTETQVEGREAGLPRNHYCTTKRILCICEIENGDLHFKHIPCGWIIRSSQCGDAQFKTWKTSNIRVIAWTVKEDIFERRNCRVSREVVLIAQWEVLTTLIWNRSFNWHLKCVEDWERKPEIADEVERRRINRHGTSKKTLANDYWWEEQRNGKYLRRNEKSYAVTAPTINLAFSTRSWTIRGWEKRADLNDRETRFGTQNSQNSSPNS